MKTKDLYEDYEWICARIAYLKTIGNTSCAEFEELQKAKKNLLKK